jgi:hypothetical protein
MFHPPRKMNVLLAWYTREAWEALRSVAPDKHALDDSFDEWELAAVEAECQLLAEGQAVSRVMIEPELFLAWCKAEGRLPDRAARSAFVLRGV